jgi:lipopolysaccharide export system permease protein
LLDSNWSFLKTAKLKPAKSFKDIVPDSVKGIVTERTISQINSVKVTLEQNATDLAARRKDLASHLIEWHRKFTMSIACLVLFLIGAPLGSIIRKGGIGTPLVFAVAFFVIFFLLNNFGEKFARQDVLTPLSGMWLATFILVPIGIFLTLKAMRDSQLFNQEFYFRFSRRFKRFVNNIKLKRKKEAVA